MPFALDARSVTADKQVLLHFARAKVLEDNKLYKEAYSSYSKANKAHGKINPFDLEKQKILFAQIKDLFQTRKQFVNSTCRPSTRFLNETKTPIFIVGMPRSGTTLVEQIISMHKEVQALGELTFLSKSITSKLTLALIWIRELLAIFGRSIYTMWANYRLASYFSQTRCHLISVGWGSFVPPFLKQK